MSTHEILENVAGTLGSHVVLEGLLKKEGCLKNTSASGPEDVSGFDYWVHWEKACFKFYCSNPPLKGCTQAQPVPCPLGLAIFDDYKIDYKEAIELFHHGNWGGSFISMVLSQPLHPDVKVPCWYFVSDLGVQVIIDANTGAFLNN